MQTVNCVNHEYDHKLLAMNPAFSGVAAGIHVYREWGRTDDTSSLVYTCLSIVYSPEPVAKTNNDLVSNKMSGNIMSFWRPFCSEVTC